MDQHKSTSILSYSTYINDPFTTHPTTALNKSSPANGLVIGCLSELHPGQIVLDSSTCLTDLLQHSSTEMERLIFPFKLVLPRQSRNRSNSTSSVVDPWHPQDTCDNVMTEAVAGADFKPANCFRMSMFSGPFEKQPESGPCGPLPFCCWPTGCPWFWQNSIEENMQFGHILGEGTEGTGLRFGCTGPGLGPSHPSNLSTYWLLDSGCMYQQKRRSTKQRNNAATNSTNFFTYQGHLANFLINKRWQDEQQMNTACVFHF